MIKKLLTLFFLICIYQISSSQNKRILITGVVKNNSLELVKDAHIINLTTQKGTISNSDGVFEIPVKFGDWLLISNVQYKHKKLKISASILKEKKLQVHLFGEINELKEVEITKKMKGILEADIIKPKKDTLPKMDKDYYNFSKMDLSNVDMGREKKPKSAQYLTDPTTKNAPVTIASVSIPDKSSLRKKALRKKLNDKKEFPEKIKKRLGEDFFFKTLKIPKKRYYHFISYCLPLKIEELYKEDKILDILKIMLKESKSYLLLIENQK